MNFYLGTHHPHWLAQPAFRDVPLFVSRRALARLKTLPRAVGTWALDSGGFTELSMHGRWTLAAADYAREVRRFRDEVGGLAWAAPQDWMCEPPMLERTGLSIEEHQRRTLENYLELRALAPDLPIIPVLQGWTMGCYLDHLDAYARAGVDLRALPVVGIGTMCRRQHLVRAEMTIRTVAERSGARLHGFGFKTQGLRACADALASADSLAWSFNARRNPRLDECTAHRNCANCPRFALQWRAALLASLGPRAEAA